MGACLNRRCPFFLKSKTAFLNFKNVIMNTSKFTLTFLLIVMTFGISNGQFGVRAGANLASLKIKVDFLGTSLSISTDDKLGGHIGAYYKEKINDKFLIKPSLLFTTGGGKVVDEFSGESSSVSSTYLGVPIDFMYTAPVGDNTLSLGGGPFVGYLLSSSSDDGSDEDQFATLDYGLNISLHFQIKSFGIGFTQGIGLANVIPQEVVSSPLFDDIGASANTRVTSLFITYDL